MWWGALRHRGAEHGPADLPLPDLPQGPCCSRGGHGGGSPLGVSLAPGRGATQPLRIQPREVAPLLLALRLPPDRRAGRAGASHPAPGHPGRGPRRDARGAYLDQPRPALAERRGPATSSTVAARSLSIEESLSRPGLASVGARLCRAIGSDRRLVAVPNSQEPYFPSHGAP